MFRTLDYPFTASKIRKLKLGDRVRLSGRVFTARDRAHQYLFEGGKCPVDLKDGAVYHCGPVVDRRGDGWLVRAAGPTTSMRMEPYTAKLIAQHHIRVIVGKGGMGAETAGACAQHGCVYLQAVGGAGAILAGRIGSVLGVRLLKELGAADAIWEFVVKDLQAVVAVDAQGRRLHERVRRATKRRLNAVLAVGLERSRPAGRAGK